MSTLGAPRSGPAFLALAAVGFIASAPALAADAPTAGGGQDRPAERDEIIVTGTAEARPPEVESPKATSDILDTSQTITVISDQTLRKQNLQTLRDALQTVPGITFGAGEGGGGYGDSINLRGYSAANDITIDGLRDSAQYSRTDPFNLQQIEVYNGANSVFNGSGSVGGTINLVSKVPTPVDLTIVQGALGTSDYYRAAIDSNVRANDLVAVRLNAMYHQNKIPGRNVEKFERWGVAPAITLGIDGPTSLTLAYVHQEDNNTPVYGVPYFKSLVNDGGLPSVDRADYYGIVNLDKQDTVVDRLTATFRHDAGDGISLRNITRWQRVGQYSQTSAPQGTFCLPNGLQPVGANGLSTVGIPCPSGLAPGQYLPSGPRGTVRDQENQLLVNQTDLRVESGERGGAFRNVLNIGVAGMIEDYQISSGSLLRTPAGAAITPLPILALRHPDTTWTGPVNKTITAQNKGEWRNLAVYAFDTLEIGELFELNGGIRWEYQYANFRALPLQITPPGTAPLTPAQQARQISREKLLSYRVGGVFHPVRDVSVYASFGNSKVPASATVRLGCGTISAPGAADPCAGAPETAKNYEAGVKAGLFDRRLELTAAFFRNERTNFRVPSNDPLLPAGLQVLDGKSRVDGITLGASGNITPQWTIFANYTYLDGKVRQSISVRDRAAGVFDAQAGQDLLQTPDHSGSLFTTYKLPFGLEIGYGLTYQGSFALNNRVRAVVNGVTIDTPQFRSDDYLIHRAYMAYTIAGGLTAQLNVQNFTNEKYYTGIRNNANATSGVITGGWAVPGDGRQATLSLFYNF